MSQTYLSSPEAEVRPKAIPANILPEEDTDLTRDDVKVMALSSLGGALEFYDFVIYVFFARIISELFFGAAASSFVALMESFAVFAIGYLFRPLGGIIFSHFGDKKGRKNMFALCIFLMAVPTFLMGCLPTYAQIGVWAPILLCVMRCMQGMAVGGEIPGACVFVAEHVGKRYKGLSCSALFCGLYLGMLLGSLVATITTKAMPEASLMSWGWRIPFLLGGVLGVVGILLQRHLEETPIFKQMHASEATHSFPIKTVLKNHKKEIAQSMVLTWMLAAVVVVFFLTMPTFLEVNLNYKAGNLLAINSFGILLFSFSVLGFGALSDRVGRRKLFLIMSALLAVVCYPAFTLFQAHETWSTIGAYTLLSVIGGFIGIVPVTLTEMFPARIRFTGFSFGYNLSYAILGGLTPLVCTTLIQVLDNPLAPAFYIIGVCVIAFCTMFFMKETKDINLHH
tara:strand:+ start:18431 stop:19786 length:1356 start_codon:yes stop_codon:yes gene_type:complete